MPYTKPVIREPYYDCPAWIENNVNRKEYLCLSAECNDQEVELFLIHLFGYNHININQSIQGSFEEILMEEEVSVLGGVAFFENEKQMIMPSCCCGLEEWRTVYDSISNRISPWLGHDPSPGITYYNDYMRVWADDPQTDKILNLQFIDFTYKEISENFEKTKKDLIGFIDRPLFQWIYKRDKELAKKMIQKMHQWFTLD